MLDILLHVDRKLLELVATYGSWVYGILFFIVFAETGFVVTPFLPGDSLLFATGALCAAGSLNIWTALALLIAAAFTGNAVNYSVGRFIGPRVFHSTGTNGISSKLLNREHLAKAHAFFLKHGGMAVVLGRFVPIVRTFVPFVAGAAEMPPPSFGVYNFAGAAGWVLLCTGSGWLFGNVPAVKDHFSLVTIGIVLVSILPMIIEYLRHRSSPAAPSADTLR